MSESANTLLKALVGRHVTQLRVDYAFTLIFWSREYSAEIRIEAPFTLTSADGQTFHVEAENVETVSPALQVLNQVASEVAVQHGTLHIEFEGRTAISVSPLPKHEAWNLCGSGGLKVVCMPGGELAVWSRVQDKAQ
jgi:hypothetical protein